MLSELLVEIAEECNGTFGFIPDGLIVGTNFVSSVANVLSTYSHSTTLRLVPKSGSKFAGPCLGNMPESEESWGRFIHVGPLQFGQARDIVIPMNLPPGTAPYLEAVLSFPREGKLHNFTVDGDCRICNQDSITASLRSKAISVGIEALNGTLAGRASAS